jgi:Caleosin related protein
MHGSDTGSYDEEGNMAEKKFSETFDKYDSDGDGYWTWGDCWRYALCDSPFYTTITRLLFTSSIPEVSHQVV